MKLDAVDGLVARVVKERRCGVSLDLGVGRNADVLLLLAGAFARIASDVHARSEHLSDDGSLGDRLLPQAPRHDVVRGLSRGDEVHGDLREELRRSPLDEQDMVRVGDAEELAHQRLRFVVHGLVVFSTMRMLHDGTCPVPPKS